MTAKKIDPSELDTWVGRLIESNSVFGPRAKHGHFVFEHLSQSAELRLDYDVTLLPPKKYFLPQRETLLTFDRATGYESVVADDPIILFGVHPYDFAAIAQLDELFSSDHYDMHYMSRRLAATIVVSDVQTASKDVFAGYLGNAAAGDRDGADVLLTRLDDGGYVVDARTERGNVLLECLTDASPAADSDLAARELVWQRNRLSLRNHELRMAPERIPELLEQSEDHPIWQRRAESCVSCGSCNLVCPTCYCFDVDDELDWDLSTGRRVRTWDGCMLRTFSEVAGGHNFRGTCAGRYRHRYYRKGKYVFDMIGEIACVGCGRCITACTANIANPVEVFNRLLEAAR
jgi:ferredoxin